MKEILSIWKMVSFLFSFNFLTLVTFHEIVWKVCHLSLLESRLLATNLWLVWRWNSLVTSRSLLGVGWKSVQAFCVCVSAKRRCLVNYVLSAVTSVTKRFPSGVTWPLNLTRVVRTLSPTLSLFWKVVYDFESPGSSFQLMLIKLRKWWTPIGQFVGLVNVHAVSA